MNDILMPVINQIIVLFIIASIGLFMRKYGIFTNGLIKGMNTFVLTVTWPCIAIMSMMVEYTPEILSEFITVMVLSIICMGLSCAIGYLIFNRHKDKAHRSVLICLSALPNVGFVGMPIVQALYGELGALYVAAFLVGFNLLTWTAGVSMFTGFGKETLKGLFRPGVLGILFGLVIFFFQIKLPVPVKDTIISLGRLNTPLAMLLMGARMDTLKVSDFADKRMWFATALKLLGIPLLMFAGLKLLGFTGILLTVPVILMGMPAASSSQMLAEKYDADSSYAAKGVSLSTLLCILSVPLLALITG